MNKKRVLILTDRPLHNGPRIIREIEALWPYSEIVAVGTTPPQRNDVKFIQAKELRKVTALWRCYKKGRQLLSHGAKFFGVLPCVRERLRRVLQEFRPDIVIAHDPVWLPYLVELKSGFKFVYNAHEYHPLEFDGDPLWMKTHGRSYYQLYTACLPHVDLFVNVCESIAETCRREFGKASLVIPNAAFYYPHLQAASVDGECIKIIHHGLALRERRLEIMVEVAQRLGDKYKLDLMLVPSEKSYFGQLNDLVRTVPNVRIISPVPYLEIAPFANRYDIGMYNLPPLSYNNRVALPNKVFEFIQARLCLVVSPSVEMARLVQKYKVGVVADGFDAAAFCAAIKRLSAEAIEDYKGKTALAALEESAEKYQSAFTRAVLL